MGRSSILKKNKDEVIELLRAGCSLTSIGDRFGVSREAVRQFAILEGVHRDWKMVKMSKSRGNVRYKREFLDVLVRRIAEVDDGVGGLAAILYLSFKKRSGSRSWGDYFALAKTYLKFRSKNSYPSIRELVSGMFDGKNTNSDRNWVQSVLDKTGLPYRRERLSCSLFKERFGDSDLNVLSRFSYSDIGYFCGCSSPGAKRYLEYLGVQKVNGEVSGLAKASMIYELHDQGYGIEMICERVGVKRRTVSYFLDNRKKYEIFIYDLLGALYPEKRFSGPYLNSQDKIFKYSKNL